MDIGKRMSEIRRQGGFSQKGMAQRLGMNIRTYQNYEYGIHRAPAEFLYNFCQSAGIKVEEFFSGKAPSLKPGIPAPPEPDAEPKPNLQTTWQLLAEIKEKQEELDKKLREVLQAVIRANLTR